MNGRPAAACVLLLALCCAAPVRAAISTLTLDTGFETARPAPATFGPWLGPALNLEGSRASLQVEGRMAGPAWTVGKSGGRLRLAAMLREQGMVRPELVVAGFARRGTGGGLQGVRLHLAGARAGTWVASSAEAASFAGERPTLRTPLLGFGAWARSHGWMLSGAVEQHVGLLWVNREIPDPNNPDTLRGMLGDGIPTVTHAAQEQVTLSTAYASLHWDATRFELETIGGVTGGRLTTPHRWAQASLAWKLSSQLALVAAAGSHAPQYLSLDPVGERHAALSLRFSQATAPAPAATIAARAEAGECQVRKVEGKIWRILVRAPGARVVELESDGTGWAPETLRPVGGGRWVIELEMAPGIHQLGLRVDGGPWLPPPGFPTAPDGFGGTVGVWVIE